MKYKYEDIELGVVLTIAIATWIFCVTVITLQEVFNIYVL
jgi:hypothetical protein